VGKDGDAMHSPEAYLHLLQRIERDQELEKLSELATTFQAALQFFKKLPGELNAFRNADGVKYDGLSDHVRPLLKQAEALRKSIDHLSSDLRTAPEMTSFVEDAQKRTGLQSVGISLQGFDRTCQAIRTRLTKEEAERRRQEADRLAEEERKREAQRALLLLPFKLIWFVVVGLFKVIAFLLKAIFSKK
jgi:hypothetical protein